MRRDPELAPQQRAEAGQVLAACREDPLRAGQDLPRLRPRHYGERCRGASRSYGRSLASIAASAARAGSSPSFEVAENSCTVTG